MDGVAVQKSFDLETTDRTVAKIKLRRFIALEAPPAEMAVEAALLETFEEAARRIVGESLIRSKSTRLARLKLHAIPALGGSASMRSSRATCASS